MVRVHPSPVVTRAFVEPLTDLQSSRAVVGSVARGCSALPSWLSLGVGSRVAGVESMM
jgi:hypothetical protein